MAKKSTSQVPDELKPVVNAKPRTTAVAPKPSATKKRSRRNPGLKAAAASRRRPLWRRIITVLLWILSFISSTALILGCFGGNMQPVEYRGICLMVMMLPGWIILMLLSTVLNIFWCRKALPLSILVWIACAAGIWEFMPFNLSRPSLEKAAEYPQFTFLTYNVTNLTDLTDRYPGGINPTVSNILKINADVVNLQEAVVLTPSEKIHLTEAQTDSLHRLYPYIIMYGKSQMLMSKYPAEAIHTGDHNKNYSEIAIFRLNIEGTPITLFDVHLSSFSLTQQDKELFKDVTDLKDTEGDLKGTVTDVKSQLLSKVQRAAELRQIDAERLGRFIDRFGGPNVIVAGDFNDVPGCYTLRYLADFKLRQVYPELGFGPMITFNRDRFYFRIDHVLYRGSLKPLRIQRGSSLASDHYPLLLRFAITDNPDK